MAIPDNDCNILF